MEYSSLERIYSSDLGRAAETATIIGNKLRTNNIFYTPLLRELDLRIFDVNGIGYNLKKESFLKVLGKII